MRQESNKNKPPAKANKPEELVTVYRSMGPLRAEVIKGKLESAGIPAILKYESASTAYAVLVNGLGEVQVLVSKSREREALEVLGETDEESSSL